MAAVRRPAVAGRFYPADARELRSMVAECMRAAPAAAGPAPKAIIAPHAGYVYSGPVAATAYARLAPDRGRIERVVLLGPAHRAPVYGLAASSAAEWETPLGRVRVDREAVDRLLDLPQVAVDDRAHESEHSLEVHLPFLQEVLGDVAIVPLAVGEASSAEVAEAIEAVWGGPETRVVISSDLSHYHDYETARRLDEATSRAVEALRYEEIDYGDACGRNPINGLLAVARRRGMRAETIDLRSSGDTAGPRDQVVGYGAYVVD